MLDREKDKEVLLQKCVTLVSNKLIQIEQAINSLKTDLLTATKSSVGDKHETGRAMIQLEMEKMSQQLTVANAMYNVLKGICIEKTSLKAKLGSVVITTKGIYFLAVSLGKINLGSIEYLVVSAQSPIGKSLIGKQKNEIVEYNNSTICEVY